MSPVISVQNLGKKYILSHQSQEHYTALRDVMANGANRLGSKLLSTDEWNALEVEIFGFQ